MTNAVYMFDFKAAVADARRMYPVETHDISFFSISIRPTESLEALVAWAQSTEQHKANAHEVAYSLAHQGAFHHYCAKTGKHAVGMRPDVYIEAFGTNKNKRDFSIFMHELGHAMDPDQDDLTTDGAFTTAKTLRRELFADVFACLHGLRSGVLTIDDVRKLSAYRAYEAWQTGGAVDHATCRALEKLCRIAARKDLTKMTPADVTALSYGITTRTFTANYIEEMEDAQHTLKKSSRILPRFFGQSEDRSVIKPFMVKRLTNIFNHAKEMPAASYMAGLALQHINRYNARGYGVAHA